MAGTPIPVNLIPMNVDLVVRSVFAVLFLGTLVAGFYLFKNFEQLFGADPRIPADNSGARVLNKVQVIAIWVHVLGITAAFALFG